MEKNSISTVLLIGENRGAETLLRGAADLHLLKIEFNLDRLLDLSDVQPDLIICAPPKRTTVDLEIAQLLRGSYAAVKILFITSDRTDFDRKLLLKNGFSDVFLEPMDEAIFKEVVTESLRTPAPSYKAVRLADVFPGAVLDFDTYLHLPTNGKFIKFSGAGQALPEDRLDRLQQKQVIDMHVSRQDVGSFYQFVAKNLKAIGSSQTMSETEKKARMQDAVRGLIGELFNDSTGPSSLEKGKSLVTDCQEIVKSYVLQDTSSGTGNWFERVAKLANLDNHAYSEASNVSAFAGLFSMALGVGKPEELAVAGLLHNIGLLQVPPEILAKDPALWTEAVKAIYYKHPEESVQMIKKMRMTLSDAALKAIAQHHERFDGTGYPERLPGVRVAPEAQVLALADEFNQLISGLHGPRLTPAQALEALLEPNLSNPVASKFNPDFLRILRRLFVAEPALKEAS